MDSLSRSSPCASIRCSAQICQAILTRVARQPANSHKHLTVFVSKSTEVREGECTEGSASLCKGTTYPKQPSGDGGGSPASLVLSSAAVNVHLSIAASWFTVGTTAIVQVVITIMLGAVLCYLRNRLLSLLCCKQHPCDCPLTFDASLSVDFHIAVIACPCSHRVLALAVIAYLGNYFKQMWPIFFSLCLLVVFILNLKPPPTFFHSCSQLFQLTFNLHLNAIALKCQMLKGESLGFHVGSSYKVSLCSENH